MTRATPPLVRRLLVYALALHALIIVLVFVVSPYPTVGDFDRFWEIGSAPGRPWIDFPVERGPLETAVLRTTAALTGTRERFAPAIVMVNAAADVAIFATLVWGWDASAAVFYGATVLPVLDLLCERLDLWSVAVATFAIAAWTRRRRFATAAALPLGGALKIWPLPLAVLLLVPSRRGRIRPIVACAVTSAAIGAVWWAYAGSSGLVQVLTFRGATGWQIESVVGVLLVGFGHLTVRSEAGADRIGAGRGPASAVMAVIALGVYAWSVWRAGRTGRLGIGWLGGVSALLLLSSLFSPQFIGWLVPGGAIAWVQRDRVPAGLTAVAVVVTALGWSAYEALKAGAPHAIALVILRNTLVAALAVACLVRLWRAPVDNLAVACDAVPGEPSTT